MLSEHITFTQPEPFEEHAVAGSTYRQRWTGMRITKDTRTDWHLVPLNRIVVQPPTFKASYISAPGQMGESDMSDVNGEMYDNRRGRWTFKFIPNTENIPALIHDMVNFLHGSYLKVTISTDTCYYLGRITVDEIRSQESGEYITLGYVLEPYKYDPSTSSRQDVTLSSSMTGWYATLNITRMPVAPYIEVWDDSDLNSDPTLHIDNPRVKLVNTDCLDDGYDLYDGQKYYTRTADGRLYTPDIEIPLTPPERRVYNQGGTIAEIKYPIIGVIDTSMLTFFTEYKGTGLWDYAYMHPNPSIGYQVSLDIRIDSTSTGKLHVNFRYIGGWL